MFRSLMPSAVNQGTSAVFTSTASSASAGQSAVPEDVRLYPSELLILPFTPSGKNPLQAVSRNRVHNHICIKAQLQTHNDRYIHQDASNIFKILLDWMSSVKCLLRQSLRFHSHDAPCQGGIQRQAYILLLSWRLLRRLVDTEGRMIVYCINHLAYIRQ